MLCNKTLVECLETYSRKTLEYMAKDKGIQIERNVSHTEMCRQIASYMLQPEIAELYFLCLFDDEILCLEQGIQEDWKTEAYEGSYVIPMLLCQSEYAFRFIEMSEDEELFWLPYDVAEVFMNMKSERFTEKRKTQNHGLSCLMAVDNFYGSVPLNILALLMKKNENEVKTFIEKLPPELNHYSIDEDTVYHQDLYLDEYGILQNQKDVSYYIPDEEELSELARFGYLPTRAEMRALVNYLMLETQQDVESAEYISMWIQKKTAAGESLHDIYNYLEEFGVLRIGERIPELTDLLAAFQRNTRKMANRGFSDMELLRMKDIGVKEL